MRPIASQSLCALLAALSIGAYAQTKVTVLSMVETRKADLETGEKKSFGSFGPDSGVAFKIEIQGPVVENAIKSGAFNIETATDDKGTDLKGATKNRFMGSGMRELNRKFMYFGEKEVPKDKVKLDLEVGLPAREAKTISVKGSIDLLVGKKVDVTVPWKDLSEGKKIVTPEITKTGLTVEITKVSDKSLNVKIAGDLETVAGVQVLDANKKSLTQGTGWSGWNDTRTYNISVKSTDGASLVITLLEDKKIIPVPIVIKDLPLK